MRKKEIEKQIEDIKQKESESWSASDLKALIDICAIKTKIANKSWEITILIHEIRELEAEINSIQLENLKTKKDL